MAKTLAQIQQQIAKLQKEADAIKAREVNGVIERIREAIAHYGITVEDLFGAAKRGRRASATAGKTATQGNRKKPARQQAGVIRFRDEAGNKWTGNGKRPKWYLDALASGKTPEDLMVSSKA